MSNPDNTEIERLVEGVNTMSSGDAADMLKSGLGGDLAKAQRPVSARIELSNVREAFTYAPWDAEQVAAGKEVTEAMIAAAEVVLRVVPESPLRTRAINGLFDARMVANAAITHRGKF